MLEQLHEEIVGLKERLVVQMISGMSKEDEDKLERDLIAFFIKNKLTVLDILDEVIYKKLSERG